MIYRRFLVCAFLSALLAGGCASASPSPAASITNLGAGQEALDPGTYKLAFAGFPSMPDAEPGALLITVPDGWENLQGWGLHRGPLGATKVAVQFWSVDQVYGHPCQWRGTLSRPGPTVDDLAKALVDRPLRNASKPVDVTIDGYAGKYLEWSVPSDAKFADCDADDGVNYFESWTGHTNGDRYHQGPGQVDRLWILDVKGTRLVIDAFDMPSATAAERNELLAVVNSIKFER